MKIKVLLSVLWLTVSVHAHALTVFKPAVLNAALLFDHDASTGDVKHSLQWIRDVHGKLMATTEVSYDRSGCFTGINMLDKANNREFHLVNKDGVLSSFKGQRITGAVNKRCEITELENEEGKFTLTYNVRGLLETMVDRETGAVAVRYEYGNRQFPVRVKDFRNQNDKRFFYQAGSEQFQDMVLVSKYPNMTVYVKGSCTYTTEGSADKCSLISATNKNYRDSTVWITNHETELF